MPENPVKRALQQRQPCLGSWCQVGHPAPAEILAGAGFKWLALDCEHGEAGDADVGPFCRAVSRFACTPLVRVKENAPLPIRRALDLGAAGVIVPLVNTANDAERAVKAAHYPPKGVRGFAWQRGNRWGAAFDAYAQGFNPVVVVMIESKEAVENIDAILAVDGVDGVLIGPYDLSGSHGIPGQTGAPVIRDACRRVAEACAKAGKAAGQHLVTPTADTVRAALGQGFTFLALGMDTFFLADGAARCLALANDPPTAGQ